MIELLEYSWIGSELKVFIDLCPFISELLISNILYHFTLFCIFYKFERLIFITYFSNWTHGLLFTFILKMNSISLNSNNMIKKLRFKFDMARFCVKSPLFIIYKKNINFVISVLILSSVLHSITFGQTRLMI